MEEGFLPDCACLMRPFANFPRIGTIIFKKRSADDPDNTCLYLTDSCMPNTRRSGEIIEISLAKSAEAAATVQSNLTRTIRTSEFYSPSPDPAGRPVKSVAKGFFQRFLSQRDETFHRR
jgi:hypothetical protein